MAFSTNTYGRVWGMALMINYPFYGPIKRGSSRVLDPFFSLICRAAPLCFDLPRADPSLIGPIFFFDLPLCWSFPFALLLTLTVPFLSPLAPMLFSLFSLRCVHSLKTQANCNCNALYSQHPSQLIFSHHHHNPT
jgi:hypothetical protein